MFVASTPQAMERKPLLTDEDLRHIDAGRFNAGAPLFGREEMRDFYEAKIASGELITKEQAEAMVEKAVDQYAEDRANDESYTD